MKHSCSIQIHEQKQKRCFSCTLSAVLLAFVLLMDNEAKNTAFAAIKDGAKAVYERLTADEVEPGLKLTPEPVNNPPATTPVLEPPQPEAPSPQSPPITPVPWKYYIDNPAENKTIPEELRENVLYLDCPQLPDGVKQRLDLLVTCQKRTSNLSDARDSKGQDASAISTSRKELLEDCNSGNLNFLIANSYQEYALEYLNRDNGSPSCILYYYALSIQFAEEALMYTEYSQSNREFLITYIKTRYEDIAYCSRIDNTIRGRAAEIAKIMGDYIGPETQP